MAEPPSSTQPQPSPRWSSLTKFFAALMSAAIAGGLLLRFQELVPPLLAAFVLAYLLAPGVEWLSRRTKLRWGTVLALVYLTLFVLLVIVLVVAGIAIQQQVTGFYQAIANFLPDLPARLQELTLHPVKIWFFEVDLSQPLVFGTFTLDLREVNWAPLYQQLVSAVQPALGQTGSLVTSMASGTATFIGWFFFTFIVSYYLLHDIKSLGPSLEQTVPPAYGPDVRRLLAELGPLWNAFLRGQLTIALSSWVVMTIVFTTLGVSFGPVLGLLAALGEFIPVIGALIVTVIAVIIALFQPSNWLGLSPFGFALTVLICYTLWQQIQGNVIVPRILGQSLKLHPALIVVGAIIGASLAGIIGLLLSAPLVATLKLFGTYTYRKIFDLDPWPTPLATPKPPEEMKWLRWVRQKIAARKSRVNSKQ
jgi:predicted PurR-regulated permease PerM